MAVVAVKTAAAAAVAFQHRRRSSTVGARRRQGNVVDVAAARHRVVVGLLVLALCVGQVRPCGPGRGAGSRRGPRKMTPLVFKQHVPNVSEHTLGASGPAEGRITRADQRFRDLVTNNNPEIVFKDEEGTGADRIMSQRCRDKLNTLAVLVINQWPGVRLRVTETWTEQPGSPAGRPVSATGGQAPAAPAASSPSEAARPGSAASATMGTASGGDSLHFEGRAVDITTSDRDRTKYGMLARLAVEAGFDWVYYESRSHIHCSVKSDSSIAASYGGCFPGHSTVRLESGQTTTMDRLSVGDRVMTFDSDAGHFRFDDVVAFVHRSESGVRGTVYQTVETVEGHRLTLTPSHLIYAADSASVDLADVRPIFAGHLRTGSYVFVSDIGNLTTSGSSPKPVRVSRIDVTFAAAAAAGASSSPPPRLLGGVYAPLTATGNIVVDDVIASCYAAFGSHRVAHAAMTPLVVGRRLADFADRWLLPVPVFSSLPAVAATCDEAAVVGGADCTHWYARALRTLTEALLPGRLWYDGADV